MNKLMAILLLLGAIAGFGLSEGTKYVVRDQTHTGMPVGEPRTGYVTRTDRIFYIVFGAACMVGGLYFIARIRREDSPQVEDDENVVFKRD
jgi:hypothetical protein